MAAIDIAPPPWCHLGTLPLDSLPLDEPIDWQALKLIFLQVVKFLINSTLQVVKFLTNFTLKPIYFFVQRALHSMNFLT